MFWTCIAAAALHDGTFDTDTAGWVEDSFGGVASPGTVVSDAGSAVFTEGDGFLVTLEQSFTTLATDTTLSFTLAPIPGFDADDVGLDDAFEVYLLDDLGVSIVPTWREGATALLSAQPDPTHSEPALLHVADGVAVTETGAVTVDLTGIPVGTHATLMFGLVGGNASTTSGITVDDVLLPHAGNAAPTSVPGADITEDCAETVSLDGSSSYDPDGDPLAYFWRDAADDELVASTVDIDLDDLVPGIHTYALTVDDGYGGTSAASVDVTITDETAPVFDAPARRSEPAALPGCTVAIPDLTHYPVDDCDDVTVTQSPLPGGTLAAGSSVTVTLTATDGSSNTATHPIEVFAVGLTGCADTTTPPNGAPVANAGADITGTCRGSVVLDGTHSSDPDFDQLTYTWRDEAGTIVDTTAVVDLGTLPFGTTTYELTVDDGFGLTNVDTVVVTSADDPPTFLSIRTRWDVESGASCDGTVPDIANSAAIVVEDCSEVTLTQSPVAGTALTFGTPTTVTVTATDAASNQTTRTITVDLVDADASCQPLAVAGADDTIACDEVVVLDGSASSSPEGLVLTYAWSDADGEDVGDEAIVDLGLLTVGSHDYTLAVTDTRETTTTDVISVSVTDTEPPVISGLPATQTTEEDGSCHANVPDLAAVAVATDCAAPTKSQLPEAGTALPLDVPTVVTVTAVDDFDQASSVDVLVTATDLDDTCDPVADAGDDQTLQCGQPVILDGTGSLDPKGDGLLYAWSIAGEPVATGGLTTIPTRAGGSYTVALSVLDSGGLTSTDEVVYDVVDDAVPVFYDPPDLATIPLEGTCAAVVPDLAAELLALDCSTVTYTQDVTAGTALTVGTPVTVTVTATDAFAQTATWQVDVIAVGVAACDTDTDLGDGDTDTLVQPTVTASVPEIHEADNPVVCGAFSAGDVAFALGTTTLSRTYSITVPAATAALVGAGSASIAGGDFGLWTQDFDLYSEATPWADHTLRVHSRELRIGLTSYNGHVWDQELPWANTFEGFEVARHAGPPDSDDPACSLTLDSDDPACALALDSDDPSWAPGTEHHEGTFIAQLPENALLLHFCSAYLAEGPGVDITLQYAFEWTSTSECTSTSGYAAIAVHDVLADPVSAPVVTLGAACDCTYLLAHKDEPGGLAACFPPDTGDADTDDTDDTDAVDSDLADTDAVDSDVPVDSDTGTHEGDTDVVDDTDAHETDTDTVSDTDMQQHTDIPWHTDEEQHTDEQQHTDGGDGGGGDTDQGLINCHGNNGHGNNEDGHDASNPGQGGGGPNGDTDPSGDVDDEIAHGHRTHPSKFDEDGDCMPLKTEKAQGTNPTDPDVDDDGIPDGHEIQNHTNPHNSDSDQDGLKDAQEEHWNTDPNNPDSDGDGQSDGYEVDHGTDPLQAGA